MTNELLAENSVLLAQRDKLIGEYLDKCSDCDECMAEYFCIRNSLRNNREPQSYCVENIKSYLSWFTYLPDGQMIPKEDLGPQVRIYVATHKRDKYIEKILPYSIFVPIHCGKAIYKDDGSEGYLPELGDNTGINISSRNPNYCELTGMYWIWKNDTSEPTDIVGLNHYRRYFKGNDGKEMPITKESIVNQLVHYDFLVNGCNTGPDRSVSDKDSVYSQYGRIHDKRDMDNAIIAISEMFPDISEAIINELKHSGAMCLCNMLITTKEKFDEYCEFLFPVLEYVDSKIDWTESCRSGYGGRALGFLSERLLRPWLTAKGYSGKATPCINWEQFSGYSWK